MSMLGDAIGSLINPGLQALFGVSAIYRRKGSSPINLTAIAQEGGKEKALRLTDDPDSTDYVIITPEFGYAAFTIAVADLASLSPAVPMRGDTIAIGNDTYSLAAPDHLSPWRYEDLPFKTWFRCHTKLAS